MINEEFKKSIAALEPVLPVYFRMMSPTDLDEKAIIRADSFLCYKTDQSLCKDFHRPISKLHDKDGRI